MSCPEDEYLQMSGLQHFAFCRRQWALIHVEQQWRENLRTVEGNILLRKTQYRVSEDAQASLHIGKCMLIGKVYNARWVLERATRDHAMSVDTDRLKAASARLKEAVARIENAQNGDSLRGIEGDAAAEYFGVFNELILNSDEAFVFCGRNRRPPLDCVNAMLSFCTRCLQETALPPWRVWDSIRMWGLCIRIAPAGNPLLLT